MEYRLQYVPVASLNAHCISVEKKSLLVAVRSVVKRVFLCSVRSRVLV